MPLISIIIPVYNGEKTIRETIESVYNQTFSDWELIVINDGSQDSTLEILSSISEPRLKIFSYPNGGQAISRNRGISQAKGEYISFLDADDLWTPDKLATQLRALQENPQAAVAYSWSDFIDESSKFLRPSGHVTVNGDALANLLLVNFLDNGSNPLIRRQALDEVGGFEASLTPAEDWDLYLRLAACYHFVAIPVPQILYRTSAGSMSTNVWKMEVACLQVLERAFSQAPPSLQKLKQPSLANIYKSLTVKAIESYPAKPRALAAIRFLYQALVNDPSLLKKRVIWKALLKIITVVLLPPQLAQASLNRLKQFFNIDALLVHIKTELP
ncbi:MAG: glycosyltransferase [Symploca sp. SIO3E6]|nr:glycosyltransferase [Caldora sp. SIO3E6]